MKVLLAVFLLRVKCERRDINLCKVCQTKRSYSFGLKTSQPLQMVKDAKMKK